MASRNVKVLPKIIGNILGTKVLAIPFPILFEKVLAILTTLLLACFLSKLSLVTKMFLRPGLCPGPG